MAGIHHVTAISGRANRNLDFYTRILGLRFVKKTVNLRARAAAIGNDWFTSLSQLTPKTLINQRHSTLCALCVRERSGTIETDGRPRIPTRHRPGDGGERRWPNG
jgi:catechol 2,3-dioxygenase-like lactoylglutathione lyase family enzyme